MRWAQKCAVGMSFMLFIERTVSLWYDAVSRQTVHCRKPYILTRETDDCDHRVSLFQSLVQSFIVWRSNIWKFWKISQSDRKIESESEITQRYCHSFTVRLFSKRVNRQLSLMYIQMPRCSLFSPSQSIQWASTASSLSTDSIQESKWDHIWIEWWLLCSWLWS